jgi:hypothetical protein
MCPPPMVLVGRDYSTTLGRGRSVEGARVFPMYASFEVIEVRLCEVLYTYHANEACKVTCLDALVQ